MVLYIHTTVSYFHIKTRKGNKLMHNFFYYTARLAKCGKNLTYLNNNGPKRNSNSKNDYQGFRRSFKYISNSHFLHFQTFFITKKKAYSFDG